MSQRVCEINREFEEIDLAIQITKTHQRHDLYLKIMIENSLYVGGGKKSEKFFEGLNDLLNYLR